jgi:WD40 repeat protein
LRGHQNYVYDIAFLDNERLISGAWDQTIRVWNLRTRQELAQWKPEGKVAYSVAYSPHGAQGGLIATAHNGGRIDLWDDQSYAHLRSIGGHQNLRMTSVSLSADGKHVAARTVKEVVVWDTADGHEVSRWPSSAPHNLCKVAISPDNRTVAADAGRGTIRLWEIGGPNEPRTLSATGQVVSALAFNHDGSLLASGSRDRDTSVRLWDVRSGRELQRFVGHSDNVYGLAFTADGARLASSSNDTTVRLWDIASGQQVAQFDGHLDYAYSVAFSPDGSMLASGSGDSTVRIWDTVPLHQRWRDRHAER